MPNPQKENGHTQIANEILEALILKCSSLNGTELSVILSVIRKTYGWNKSQDKISIGQLQEMTGKGRRTIIYAMQNLEAKKILIIDRQMSGKVFQPSVIKFNKKYDEWVVQNSAPQIERNKVRAQESSAKLRTSAKVRTRVVQNYDKTLVQRFAPTKDTITKDTITKDTIQKTVGNREKSFEHPIVQNLWKTLESECEALGLENKVQPQLFEKIYFEFFDKLPTMSPFGKELKACLFYHRDKNKRVIRSAAIRNWFVNAVKFAKEADIRRKTANADKAASVGMKAVDLPASLRQVSEKMSWND